INTLDLDESTLDRELAEALGTATTDEAIAATLDQTVSNFQAGSIIKGRIVDIVGDDVVVDVGLKSEGVIPISEWDDRTSIDPGDEIDVWLESVESDSGLVQLSKRKADRMLNWQRIVQTAKEGDDVKGRVMRKIKGGL